MPTWEVICLANSWKHGGRCVAGLRLDGGGWVRPISREPGGVLQPWHYTLASGGEAAVGDTLQMRLTQPWPDPHHPENWCMDYGLWTLVARPLPLSARAFLANSVITSPALLGDSEDRVAYQSLLNHPASTSLALVRPEGLHWEIRKSPSSGKRQNRAVFCLGGVWYNLPLTDPLVLNMLAPRPLGSYPDERPDLLLTISLSEPFERDGFCYKLVAAVISLS